uniref:Uncharacterized protein n=1 Tax=Macaca fascicularis TaxID=9541 RepID=A0A7N9CMH1_MACFA
MNWYLHPSLLKPQNTYKCLTQCLVQRNISRVHMYNLQVCYICIHVPCWCAAPINLSVPINSSFTSV